MSQRAALQNLDAAWHKTFEKVGLDVVIVAFETQRGSPIWSHPEIEESLGLELQQVTAGRYDSTFYNHDSRWLFFHCNDLGKAVQRLKSQLETRGLLPVTRAIMHVETSGQLRVWYSRDAEAIGQLVEG